MSDNWYVDSGIPEPPVPHGNSRNAANAKSHASDDVQSTMQFSPLPPAAQFTGPSTAQPASDVNLSQFEDRSDEGAATSHGHVGLIVTLVLLFLLIAAAVGGFFAAQSYFSDKAAPGVMFGSRSVAGQNAAQLTQTVTSAVSDSRVEVADNTEHDTKVSLKDLGVMVNVKATVNKLLQAKSSAGALRINPFQRQQVALVSSTDESAMSDYLTTTFVPQNERAKASTVAYDKETKQFVVTVGRQGKAPQLATVKSAVAQIVNNPGSTTSAAITYGSVSMPISEDAARQTADTANKQIDQSVEINNGEGKSFTIPADVLATWIKPTSNLDKGTVTLQYDQDAISAYLQSELPKQLNQDPVTQEDITNAQGTVLTVTTKGVNGVTINNTDTTAQKVLDSLTNGSTQAITAETSVEKFTTNSHVADYTKPNGDMWIEVDRAKQIATVYKGSTLVKTFNVCTGKDDTQTDSGTYYVNIKYQTQDMRGADYFSPGVKWISYFNGGEGFHSAPWNPVGIATGNPVAYGSHGCVNMTADDAQWVFENAGVGTMVKVIGAQPTGAVR
ncbi:L,D-transpeptidase family protein [Bifidobacterium aquikefiricola]|uniref:L,D-transpeptidase family protein n=1 Tax=Bifidobacterium aquikefiricola TaxID=3059038 RepID=A0AB39U7I2_9BIFI